MPVKFYLFTRPDKQGYHPINVSISLFGERLCTSVGYAIAPLKYDVDCSTVGTQSCNGRLPVNGASRLYLGFENVRVRYTNYLWVEAMAVVATTEYYRTKYTVD